MYRELYSLFRQMIKVYTEKLDVNEFGFMFLISEAAHIFQGYTEIWEKKADIHRINGNFYVPYDFIRPVILKDGKNMVFNIDPQQEEMRKFEGIHSSIPENIDFMKDEYGYNHEHGYGHERQSKCYSIYENEIHIETSNNVIRLKYIPNFDLFSEASPYWNVWSPILVVGVDTPVTTTVYRVLNGTVTQTGVDYYSGQTFICDGSVLTTTSGYASYAPRNTSMSWYFIPNFMNMFNNTRLPRVFQQHIPALLNYCKSKYLHDAGLESNGELYEKKFMEAIALTKKLNQFNMGSLNYRGGS
jgi:hypothetical protein